MKALPEAEVCFDETERAEHIQYQQERIKMLTADIGVLDLRLSAAHRKLEQAKELLQECCDHQKIEQKSDYYGGSYDEVARTTYWNECLICGTRSESWSKSHGHYG